MVTFETVQRLRLDYARGRYGLAELAERTGLGVETVREAVLGQGFSWIQSPFAVTVLCHLRSAEAWTEAPSFSPDYVVLEAEGRPTVVTSREDLEEIERAGWAGRVGGKWYATGGPGT